MLVLVAPVASKALKVVVIATLNVFAAADSFSFLIGSVYIPQI